MKSYMRGLEGWRLLLIRLYSKIARQFLRPVFSGVRRNIDFILILKYEFTRKIRATEY
jgi:hypothetical protein